MRDSGDWSRKLPPRDPAIPKMASAAAPAGEFEDTSLYDMLARPTPSPRRPVGGFKVATTDSTAPVSLVSSSCTRAWDNLRSCCDSSSACSLLSSLWSKLSTCFKLCATEPGIPSGVCVGGDAAPSCLNPAPCTGSDWSPLFPGVSACDCIFSRISSFSTTIRRVRHISDSLPPALDPATDPAIEVVTRRVGVMSATAAST
mmetsp:Transcript_44243/g.140789  ORF Transcript_44243/g.140789 Transcript_44243/m.140789 type:complete len:201 (-) Transcript_44243:349-951(-)